eukprot:g3464.t1
MESTATTPAHAAYDSKIEGNIIFTRVDAAINWMRKNSLWPMPMGLACCAIELMATASSRFDISRFGAEVMRFSPRQADVMIVAGTVTYKMALAVKRVWDQMPEPKWCIAMGACASSGGMYRSYAVLQGIDNLIPGILTEVEFRGEITLNLTLEALPLALKACKQELNYELLLDISSIDHFGQDPRFEVLYELASLDDSRHIRLKAKVSEDESVPTAVELWHAADWHEREVYDMMGIKFSDHPNLKRILIAKSTWQLVRILILVQGIPFLWNFFTPHGPDKLYQLQYLLGLNPPLALAGKFWQFGTYGLIHGNWTHLLLNVAAILLLASKLEQFIAKRSFWILVILSTLSGATFFTAGELLGGGTGGAPARTLVGSSAICFSFLLFLTTLSPESKFLPFFLSGRSIGLGIILANAALAVLNPSLPTGPLAEFGAGISSRHLPDLFDVSHACHLGGSLTGFLYGRWLLRPRISLTRLKRAREKREAKSKSNH